MPALLVDLGGTHLRLGIWHKSAHVVERRRIQNSADELAGAEIWERIVTDIAEFAAGPGSLLPLRAPVVVSFPGPVVNRSRIADAPTVTGASEWMPDLQSAIAERTRREVHILNDISAAAWHLSRRIAARRFMVVTVSSGIGSKMFDRDHALGVIDDVPYAGEIGHIKVDEKPDAPSCDCGGRGHLGAIASGRGILRLAKRLAKTDEEFSRSLCMTRFEGTAESLTNEEHLVPAARLGDAWALGVVREGTVPLARLLLQSVITGGIESVVVIGGFALGLGEVYRAILQEEMLKRCDYRIMPEGLRNLIVMGDEDACLLGTAAYASRVCGS